MTGHHAAVIDDEIRRGITVILDAILPGSERLPRGGGVRAQDEMIDLVLAANPALQPPLTRVATIAAAQDSCTWDEFTTWAGDDIETLIFALHAAYYMTSEVREVLGYQGQQRRPIAQATSEELTPDALIAPVEQRGAIYVPTPPS